MPTTLSTLRAADSETECRFNPLPHRDVRASSPTEKAISPVRSSLRRAAGTFGRAASALILAAMVLAAGCSLDPRQIDLFEGTAAQDALAEVSQKIGHPARALNMDITPLSLIVRVQDPAQPMHIDEYAVVHGYALNGLYHYKSIYGPKPVQPSLVNNSLEENLFNLSEVNMAGVAEAVKSAVNLTAVENGGAEKIHIQRHLYVVPSIRCGDIEWEIHVRSDREFANAYADAKGRITRLNLDGTNRALNLNLFTDANELQHIVDMMRGVFGSTPGILKLNLNKNLLSFDARDPQKPKRLMSYSANLNGVRMGLDAFGGGPGAPPLPEDRFFALDDADWSRVPDILKQAQQKLEIPNGRFSLITLAKPPFAGTAQPLRWTVEILDEEGEKGEAQFDPGGVLMNVKLPGSRRAQVSMFEPDGAGKAILGIRKTFGPHAKLIQLQFDEHRALITAANPKQPDHLREFLYDEDHFVDIGSDMTPFYRNHGVKAESFFDLDEMEAALSPKLTQMEKTTFERLKITNGKIDRITITRHPIMQPINPKITVEIQIMTADERTGQVTFDLQGNVLSMMTP